MPYYETVFIARQELSAKQVEELADTYAKVLTKDGGKIHKTEHWGLRTLAYKINKSRKGFYVMIESEASAASIIEMERQMRLSDDVMRYMTLKLEELSTGPSVMAEPEDDHQDKKEAA